MATFILYTFCTAVLLVLAGFGYAILGAFGLFAFPLALIGFGQWVEALKASGRR